MRAQRIVSVGVVLVGIASWLAGCAKQTQWLVPPYEPLNAEAGPGDGVEIDTLSPTKSEAHRSRNPYRGPSPSVVGIDRDNWQPTQFAVPISGVNHHTHYTDDKPRFARETARARGEFPTQATVLETGTADSVGSLALEGVAAPARAAWDILRFPLRAWRPGQRPWSVKESPVRAEWYARGPVEASQYVGTQSALKPTLTGTAVPGSANPEMGTQEPDGPEAEKPLDRPGAPTRFKDRGD